LQNLIRKNREKKKLNEIINDDSSVDKVHAVLMQLDERIKKRSLIYFGYLLARPTLSGLWQIASCLVERQGYKN
jgi:aryl carrier-like protein